jgi:AraC-like DNA-binding protein
VWCRLLLAADLLAGGGRTVDQVALSFDFPSANAFRNMLRRHAGLGPADVRGVGSAGLLAAFRLALAGGARTEAGATVLATAGTVVTAP